MHPLKLRPKEGLAIMNGTAVMTALACLAWERAEILSRLSTRLTACNVIASAGNAHHFDGALFAAKPHAGQQLVAARLRQDLASDAPPRNEQRLQDRYSLSRAAAGIRKDVNMSKLSRISLSLGHSAPEDYLGPGCEFPVNAGFELPLWHRLD